jgi:hypothetical protein
MWPQALAVLATIYRDSGNIVGQAETCIQVVETCIQAGDNITWARYVTQTFSALSIPVCEHIEKPAWLEDDALDATSSRVLSILQARTRDEPQYRNDLFDAYVFRAVALTSEDKPAKLHERSKCIQRAQSLADNPSQLAMVKSIDSAWDAMKQGKTEAEFVHSMEMPESMRENWELLRKVETASTSVSADR